jgi:hypothetical protein
MPDCRFLIPDLPRLPPTPATPSLSPLLLPFASAGLDAGRGWASVMLRKQPDV